MCDRRRLVAVVSREALEVRLTLHAHLPQRAAGHADEHSAQVLLRVKNFYEIGPVRGKEHLREGLLNDDPVAVSLRI